MSSNFTGEAADDILVSPSGDRWCYVFMLGPINVWRRKQAGWSLLKARTPEWIKIREQPRQ